MGAPKLDKESIFANVCRTRRNATIGGACPDGLSCSGDANLLKLSPAEIKGLTRLRVATVSFPCVIMEIRHGVILGFAGLAVRS
jgi:hypothetical protein